MTSATSKRLHRRSWPAQSMRSRLNVERLESRNLFDAGLANILVNDPTLDQPELLTLPDGSTRISPHDTQSETALVLGSGNRVIVAYNDSGSEIHFNGIGEFNGFSTSANGGSRFKDRGTLPRNPYGFGGDPVLARSDRTGTIFLSTLSWALPHRSFTGRINIFRSFDDGQNWELPVNGTPGFEPGVARLDKEWITVDNFAGPGYGNVYLVVTDLTAANGKAGTFLTRSVDDGVTWGPDGGLLIAPGGNGESRSLWTADPYVTVGPDHAVYVFWLDYHNHAIRMRKSTDQGVTFGGVVTVADVAIHSQGGDLGLTDSSGNVFRADSAPQAVVNPTTGDIYLIYTDNPSGATDRADIFFVQSTDGGQTWSPRLRVNDDATTNDQWQPALAVTPDGSRVGMFWYDRRLDSTNNLIDWYGAIATVSGSTVAFGPNFRITDVSFPPAFGQDPDVSPNYMGDYDQAVADNRYFYTTWGDNRLANPNYAPHVNQPDVRFAKIPVNWTGGGSALLAAGVPPAGNAATQSQTLRAEGVQPLFAEALNRWAKTRIDVSSLQGIDVRLANLGGLTLGLASGRTIWLDDNAAGWGWFVDPTPSDDSEFLTPGNQGERNRMDLLTVLEHEIGHVLGYEHEESGVMIDTLPAGTRRLSGSDVSFSDLAQIDWVSAAEQLLPAGQRKK